MPEKDFDRWNENKKKIDKKLDRPNFYREGDLWWTLIGLNIGVENNGKGINFNRPVLILKKINKFSCLIVPLSSKMKAGYFYKKFVFKGKVNILLFNQIRIIDTARLFRRIGEVNFSEFVNIKNHIKRIL